MAQIAVESEASVQEYQAGMDDAAVPATDPEYEAWFRRKVEAGMKAYREGRVILRPEKKLHFLECCRGRYHTRPSPLIKRLYGAAQMNWDS